MEDKENETSLTNSAIMSDSGVHSTPVPTKESSRSYDKVMNFLSELIGGNETTKGWFKRWWNERTKC